MNEQQKAEIRELYRQGYTSKDLTRRLKLSRHKIYKYIRECIEEGILKEFPVNDINANDLPKVNKTKDNMIYAIIQRDRTLAEGNIKEIAEQLGVSFETVKFMLSPTYFKRAQGTHKRYPVFLYDLDELEDE